MQSSTVQLSFPSKLQPDNQLEQFAAEVIVPPLLAFAHDFMIQAVVDVAAVVLPQAYVPLSPLKAAHVVEVPLYSVH